MAETAPALSPGLPSALAAPSPRAFPVLGHLPSLAADVIGFFVKSHREHGDTVFLRLGAWPTLLLAGSDDIETVLVKEHMKFHKNSFFWRHVTAIFGNGLLTNEGASWQKQRRLAAPAFSGQRLAAYPEIMVGMTEATTARWADGETRDMHAEMMGLALRIAAKTMFDAELREEVAGVHEAVDILSDEIVARFARPFVIPDWVPIPGNFRYRRALRTIDDLIAGIVKSRRASGEDKGDLLSMLIKARDENGRPMSDRQLRDEAVNLLLAGHETTALTLTWALMLIGQHPEIEAKLLAEIDEALQGRPPTQADLPNLRYADKVVMEVLRLYPPVWSVGREAVEDCEVGGALVPKGTTIVICAYAIHRDPKTFPDPEAFDPSRWDEGYQKRMPRFAYLPFGGGPRICIGMRFAMIETVLVLVTLLQRFRYEVHAKERIPPFASITIRPKGGLPATLRQR